MRANLRTARVALAKKRLGRQWNLYLMLCGTPELIFVKVGISSDVKKRIAAVQTGCPFEIKEVRFTALRSYLLAKTAEGGMHKALAPMRSYGEWFRLASDSDRAAFNQALKDLWVGTPEFGFVPRWQIYRERDLREIAREKLQQHLRRPVPGLKENRRKVAIAAMALKRRHCL